MSPSLYIQKQKKEKRKELEFEFFFAETFKRRNFVYSGILTPNFFFFEKYSVHFKIELTLRVFFFSSL